MAISFRTVRNSGLGVMMLIVVLVGILPTLSLVRVAKPEAKISSELATLLNIVKINSLFYGVVDQLDDLVIEENSDIGPILRSLDKVIVYAHEIEKLSDASDKGRAKEIQSFIKNARIFKVAVVSYVEEMKYDPAGSSVIEMEILMKKALGDTQRALTVSVKDVYEDIQTSRLEMSYVLRESQNISLIGLFAGILAAILVSIIFAKMLSKPIRDLVDGTKRIAKGDLSFRLKVDAKDEIGFLADAFNQMGERLQKHIDNEKEFAAAKLMVELEKERIKELENISVETIIKLSKTAEYKDQDTGSHILRISYYAQALAKKMKMDSTFVKDIFYAAPMHDIGKIGIPEKILLKRGKLSEEEFEIIKTHTSIGAAILNGSSSEFLQMAFVIALTHHERWDGSGYPQGLKGEDIPMAGRITAIVDAFDALVSRRPYKEPFEDSNALDIIAASRGTHFDPQVCDSFLAIKDEILSIEKTYQDKNPGYIYQFDE
ncbi:MAG: HAMP domain-containing protein [Candidatus Omnitrophica bacterium]|nr:HAMP domain-containing protein [Candidatus Omnitrophota bacterium]MBU1997715.1 HAMP domain-containing protein [Candidatus Omnitrophota bacterium]MBU4333091.1 HAMP domain-containing protein [Candidatus Omnitrophota bacterium]